jgi:hypothetical protein
MAPTIATLEAQVNGGAWSTLDQIVNANDTVRLRWSSYNANICSGTGSSFSTGNNTAGTDIITTPAASTNETFEVFCTGPATTDDDSLIITSRQRPELGQPSILYTPSVGYDATTGEYDSVAVTFQTGNYGGSDTQNSANYQFQFDRSANGYEVTTTGALGILTVGQVFPQTQTITDVPFGPTRIRVELDGYPGVGAVAEIDETNNYRELSFNLPPPNPGLNISANRTQVRSGETVDLTWTTGATYPMACRVYGPGISPAYTFDPSVNGPTAGSPRTSGPITAKSEFTLSCVENSTGTAYTFTDVVTIEAQGAIEEI